MAIGVPGNPKSSRAVLTHMKCIPALESETYSASVVEVETDFCVCDRHEIVDNPKQNKLLDTDLHVFTQLP
jgi:hypothetical protein